MWRSICMYMAGLSIQLDISAIRNSLSLLFVGSYVDLHEHWIPDRCSIGLIISGLILSIFFPELHKVNTPIDSLIKSFIGLFCIGILLFVRWIGFWILKKEAMGLGDVKLLAGI